MAGSDTTLGWRDLVGWASPAGWTWAAVVVAGVVAIPIVAVLWIALFPTENIWPHLIETVLPGYVLTTLLLMVGVVAGTVTIGVGTAWLVTMYRFPGRQIFAWAMMLPLAVPTYVVAYVYTDVLEFAGPVQGALRSTFGWSTARDYWFPEIRSLGGAIAVMSLALYPYVYLLARSAFIEQSTGTVEAARTLGCSGRRAFWRISLPMARPSIAIGAALVMMETLNDFGTVDYFAVQTLTTGLFNVWFVMNNSGGAAQIAIVMLLFVVALLSIERFGRKGRRFHATTTRVRHASSFEPDRGFALVAFTVCALPVLLGFVIPGAVLLGYSIDFFDESWSNRFPEAALNTVVLALCAAGVAVMVGLFLAYAVRVRGGRLIGLLARFASLGYAIPGAVIAVGVLVPFGAFDNAVDSFLRRNLGVSTGLLLSGTIFAIMFAYVVRFLALSQGTIEAGLTRVTPNMEMAARTLGLGPAKTLIRVNLPLIRASLLTAAILVFVDCMKELPATLILRPFNFDTLATYVYQFASDELLEECALGALAIVVAGIVPVILLSRTMGRQSAQSV